LTGVTFGSEDEAEGFGESGSGAEVASGGVATGERDDMLAPMPGSFVLPVFFRTATDVIDESLRVAAEGFADLLGAVVESGVEALVDFCRVPFLTGSILSAAIDSDTTFFGLPLFFTTSADILVVLWYINSGVPLRSKTRVSAVKIISRHGRGDAT
jgi:hypothetical protein